ncbi:MAG: flagellar basal body rod C-terminal domain-containing protein [Vulcanimicrobiota bacterium]
MDWFAPLRTSVSGLEASRARLNAATNNLANADNSAPDDASVYQRQLVQLQENKQLGGVSATPVNQVGPPRIEFLPGHPDADEHGMVRFPEIDTVEEMTELMAARRAYETGIATYNEGRHMFNKTLEIGKES